MSRLPATTGAAPSPETPPAPIVRPLTKRMESYARALAAGMSYGEAFREAGLLASTAGSRSQQIQTLNRDPRVRRRVAELKTKVDEDVVADLKARCEWLRQIVNADPEELTRVVSFPCGECWTDERIAAHYAAHFAPCEMLEERPALPDPQKPRHDCQGCNGVGLQRVIITPTDELSPAGRALFLGAEQDKDGVIKLKLRDQTAAADMLNKLQGAYVTKSLNLNANVAVQAARDVSPADAMRLFEAFGK